MVAKAWAMKESLSGVWNYLFLWLGGWLFEACNSWFNRFRKLVIRSEKLDSTIAFLKADRKIILGWL